MNGGNEFPQCAFWLIFRPNNSFIHSAAANINDAVNDSRNPNQQTKDAGDNDMNWNGKKTLNINKNI